MIERRTLLGKKTALPLSLAPRGLSRIEAAEYVGVSPSKFDQVVKDGRMPKPKRIDGRTVWDVRQLNDAFDNLPSENNGEDTGTAWDVAHLLK